MKLIENMKCFAFYIAILCLTFAFSVAATKCYFSWHIQFECTALFGILVPPDGSGRGASYKSFDGVKLSSTYSTFPSRQAAEAALDSSLREATEIVERKPLPDGTGERIVARFPPNEIATDGYIAIITLENDSLFEIASTSLRHAVAFENGALR